MVLAEAQSIWSVNIVVRTFLYLAQTWNDYIEATNQNRYGSRKPRKTNGKSWNHPYDSYIFVSDDGNIKFMENHSGWLNVLLPEKNTLVVFEWDCLNLSVYNPPEEVQSIMQKIAASEGLFWWKSEVSEA